MVATGTRRSKLQGGPILRPNCGSSVSETAPGPGGLQQERYDGCPWPEFPKACCQKIFFIGVENY